MEILIYVGKVSLYLTLFYACYRLFLRQHTFFVWNRIYLLGSLLVSFVLPFIIYPASAPEMPVFYVVSAPAFTISEPVAEKVSLFTWTNFGWSIYVLGMLFMCVRLYNQIRQLNHFLKEGELIELEDCKVVLINSNHVGSFSFLKWIVVNRNDYENHFDSILRHEMVHMHQRHTLDVLLVEFLKIVLWFNPIIILYKKSLQEVHEFLADAEAVNREHYATFLVSYALNAPIASLTNHFFKPSQIKTRIQMIYKNRTSKWLKSSYVAAILFIGITALFVASCEQEKLDDKNVSDSDVKSETGNIVTIKGTIVDSDKKGISGAKIMVSGKQVGTVTDENGNYAIQTSPNSMLEISSNGLQSLMVKVDDQTAIYAVLAPSGHSTLKSYAYLSENATQALEKVKVDQSRKVFTVVEQQPQFPGGNKAMYEFLGNNIKYPENAAKAKISGRVFLSFVVTETGEIQDIQILKGLGYGCDAEAVRVLKSFPKWQPGMQDGIPVAVKYNLPINFQLQTYKRKTTSEAKTEKQLDDQKETELNFGSTNEPSPNSSHIVITDPAIYKPSPLYVVNGKIEEDQDILKKINPDNIKSLSVLKGKKATDAYGEKGENGVVSIITK